MPDLFEVTDAGNVTIGGTTAGIANPILDLNATASPVINLRRNGTILGSLSISPSHLFIAGGATGYPQIGMANTGEIRLSNGNGLYPDRFYMNSTGKIGIGGGVTGSVITAQLHLSAGTAITPPIRLTSGTLCTGTDIKAGNLEFLTDDFYATITTGAARKGIILDDGTNLTLGRIPIATTNGRLTDDADLTFTGGNTLNTAQLNVGTGTTVTKIISATATLDFPSTSAQTSSDLTITLTGAALGDIVNLGVPNGSVVANSAFSAWVSSTNTVTVRLLNASAGAIDPASGTFRVAIMQF